MSTGKRTARPTYPSLLAWRRSLHLNQREAAAVLDISQSTYGRVERGIRHVKGPLAKKLMSRTGVPLEKLAGVA